MSIQPVSGGRRGGNGGLDPAFDIIEWLSGDDCHRLDDAGLIAGLGSRLREAAIPLDRLTLHLRTLHPEIFARTVAWAPNEPVEIHDRAHGVELSAAFAGSPLRRVMDTRQPLVVRSGTPGGDGWLSLDVFRDRGLVEFVITPLCGADAPTSAVTFGTTRAEGFEHEHRLVLDRIVPSLRTACEVRGLRQVEATLLDTYVGSATAQRILAGHVRVGDVESLDAALLLCDLRDFTSLSNRLPAQRVLELLNAYFDCVVPAIVDSGGEILKFMGDAVLAFFHRPSPAAACAAALDAARRALDELSGLSPEDAQLRAGIALHYGTVSYGNIGSGSRLDFTLIGRDVNLVSRIQTACASSGRELLMSKRFVELLQVAEAVSVGLCTLKGFDAPVELFTICRTERSASIGASSAC